METNIPTHYVRHSSSYIHTPTYIQTLVLPKQDCRVVHWTAPRDDTMAWCAVSIYLSTGDGASGWHTAHTTTILYVCMYVCMYICMYVCMSRFISCFPIFLNDRRSSWGSCSAWVDDTQRAIDDARIPRCMYEGSGSDVSNVSKRVSYHYPNVPNLVTGTYTHIYFVSVSYI